MTFHNLKIQIPILASIVAALIGVQSAGADVVFDFSPTPGDYIVESGSFDHSGFLTRGGITARLAAHSDQGLFVPLGKINFSTEGVGISIVDGTNNDEFLFDLASSDTFGDVNERLLLSFDQTVRIDSFTLHGLGDGSLAQLTNDPENDGSVFADFTGTSNTLDTFDVSDQNIVLQSGEKIGLDHVTGGGFKMASFTVTAVPEPSSFALTSLLLFGLAAKRRKKKLI